MSMYAMDKTSSPIARDAARPERERMPQVREQLDYLGKAVEILMNDAQRLLARIAPVQRQEPKPTGPMQDRDGRCEVKLSAALASEVAAMVARIESVSRDLREGCDLLEI